ncbi:MULTISPECIES: helix-turn-helix transcriptional regulator [unclassified Janthinobacterium]|uniref:helix-turn-helix transcriptional regulator n=1 Tax=unclassified Janthinobacterium TaxID=2610881 RepID=UPI00034A291B|nr:MULTISPECIES: AlpA family phage regulatory protein [unclassified Janthinobacterium]MEC5161897.1 prophage regulatory protein [Janthinobacterium sp. CG_S6]
MTIRPLTPVEMKVFDRILIKRKQLLLKVPLCERTILDMEKRGEFPKRFSITCRLVAWDLGEVDGWIARQKAMALQPRPPGDKNSQ